MKAQSFANIIALVNNKRVSGFAEGDGVLTVEHLSKPKVSFGADGVMVVSFPAGKHGKVVLTLLAESSGNAFMQGLYDLQQSGPDKFIPVQLGVKDSYRQDIFAGVNGVITDPAKFERGETAGKQSWEITFEQIRIVLGDPQFAGLATAIAEAAAAGRASAQ